MANEKKGSDWLPVGRGGSEHMILGEFSLAERVAELFKEVCSVWVGRGTVTEWNRSKKPLEEKLEQNLLQAEKQNMVSFDWLSTGGAGVGVTKGIEKRRSLEQKPQWC